MEYNINAVYESFFVLLTKVQFRLCKFTSNCYYFCFKVWLFFSQPVKELSRDKQLDFYFSICKKTDKSLLLKHGTALYVTR